MNRNLKGQFVSAKAQLLLEQSRALEEQANELIAQESEPPIWLKRVMIALAQAIGITPKEFEQEVKIIHPTPDNPVLMIRNKALVSWI